MVCQHLPSPKESVHQLLPLVPNCDAQRRSSSIFAASLGPSGATGAMAGDSLLPED